MVKDQVTIDSPSRPAKRLDGTNGSKEDFQILCRVQQGLANEESSLIEYERGLNTTPQKGSSMTLSPGDHPRLPLVFCSFFLPFAAFLHLLLRLVLSALVSEVQQWFFLIFLLLFAHSLLAFLWHSLLQVVRELFVAAVRQGRESARDGQENIHERQTQVLEPLPLRFEVFLLWAEPHRDRLTIHTEQKASKLEECSAEKHLHWSSCANPLYPQERNLSCETYSFWSW